ncbi:MAG: hypothetical protein L6R35_000728 [Caloplaca aegaea]|nr:MAG: hypothetical protein L6R35_000728 [Caloplaca aegaea]
MDVRSKFTSIDQHSTPSAVTPAGDSMFRQRQRRASDNLGDDLRGDTGAAALATLEQTPVSDSPSDSDTLKPKARLSQEQQEPQKLPEPQEPHEHQDEPPDPPRLRPRRRRIGARSWRGWLRRWGQLSWRDRLRRYGQFSLRYTWVNPLIIIALVLTMYGIDPTPTNPLHSAIFLSYPLDPSNPLIPADVRSDPEAPVHYGKGLKDFAFFAFYVVVLSFTRESIMQLALRPLARWFGIRARAKQNRFMEQVYTALYFGIFGPYGLWVMYNSPVWYFDTIGMYETFPNRTHDALFKAYYLLQASYWGQQAIVLCLMLEKPRRDFKELIAHHIVTLSLIWLSYHFHFTYMGLAVYITHDVSDFFLATSKTFSYLDLRIVEPYFAVFMAVWIYLRHYLNLVILHSVTTTFVTVGPFELDWATQQYKCWIAQYITFGLLTCLQLINLFWLYFILRIAARIFTGGETKDDRSDDEGDDAEEDDDDGGWWSESASESEDGEREKKEEEEEEEESIGEKLNRELANGALREAELASSASGGADEGVRQRRRL